MKLFDDKLFDRKKETQQNKVASGSRYTFEVLSTAYANMWYRQAGDNKIAMLTLPVNDPLSDEAEVYFHSPKEDADMLMKELFLAFPQIDAAVQGDSIDDYDIAYFNIYDDKIEIGYFGTKDNSNFDVILIKNQGQWYCTEIGMRKFNPPERVDNIKLT